MTDRDRSRALLDTGPAGHAAADEVQQRRQGLAHLGAPDLGRRVQPAVGEPHRESRAEQ